MKTCPNYNRIADTAPLLRFLFAFLLLLPLLPLLAEDASDVRIRVNSESGLYSDGEKVVFEACRLGNESDPVEYFVLRDFSETIATGKIELSADWKPVHSFSSTKPASYQLEIKSGDRLLARSGVVIEAQKIETSSRIPADFDDFWKKKKERQFSEKKEPILVPVKSEKIPEDQLCFDVEIPCLDSGPARGYFTKPSETKPKSLPAVIFLHSAGVSGEGCLSKPENALRYSKRGALALDLNAHGMLNGQSPEYYNELNTTLKGYPNKGVENADTWYFVGMYSRLMAAIDFITSQPEWDGQRLLLTGESMGGGQSLAGAGLDSRVSHVLAIVPALCDFTASLHGKKAGWPNVLGWDMPTERKQLLSQTTAYCDAANLSTRSKANTFIEVGLADPICPPSSIFAAYNALKGKKQFIAVPFREHLHNTLPEDLIT